MRNRLVDPMLYGEGKIQLPDICDLQMLAALPDNLFDNTTSRKIDTIVNYVLQPDYQRLPEGYGIMLGENRRYWAIGWSMHLPGYFELNENASEMRRLVRMATLMAHFSAARHHPWLRQVYEHLDAFRTSQDTYRFPSHYLHEGQSGDWIMGIYMGLEENRRRKVALELESTFWMRKLASLGMA